MKELSLSEAQMTNEPVYTVSGVTIHAHPCTTGHVKMEKAQFVQAYKEDFAELEQGRRWCIRCFGKDTAE